MLPIYRIGKTTQQLVWAIFAFTSCVVFAETSNNQDPDWPALQVQSPQLNLMLDITQTTSKRIVAVGERGIICYSDDQGLTWRQAQVPTFATLTSVFFINASTGWAAGHDATILNTTDGGEHWQKQWFDPKARQPILDIAFQNAQQGVAVGAYGLYLTTNDAGKNWQNEFIDSLEDPELGLPHFNRILLTDGRFLMVGEAGLVAESLDKGKHWRHINSPYQGSFFDLAYSDGIYILSGLRGHSFRFLPDIDPAFSPFKAFNLPSDDSIVASTADHTRIWLVSNKGHLFAYDKQQHQLLTASVTPNYAGSVAGLLQIGPEQFLMVGDKGIQKVESKLP